MTYQLLLTTLGKQKLAAAASAGSQPVRITQFVVGQGMNVDFSQRLDQQVLVSKRYQAAVNGVAATAVVGQYEITCIVPQNQGGWFIREIGLIDSEGSLIWVGQVPEVQKPVASSTAAVDYRIKAVISIDNPDVNLVIDANVVTATQSWAANNFVTKPDFQSHLNASDPHSDYLLEADYHPFDESVLSGYVLKATYDSHVKACEDHIVNYDEHVNQNQQQHKVFTDWQIDHTTMLDKDRVVTDPHPQYVRLSVFNAAIAALNKRIDDLSLEAGVGTVLGRLDMSFSGSTNSYSAFATINNVLYTVAENGDFNFILSSRFNNGSIGEVNCRDGDSSLLVNLYYPEGFDPTKHGIRSSRSYVEREDGKGIYFPLPYTSDKEQDSNFYKYFISTSFYFEIVKK